MSFKIAFILLQEPQKRTRWRVRDRNSEIFRYCTLARLSKCHFCFINYWATFINGRGSTFSNIAFQAIAKKDGTRRLLGLTIHAAYLKTNVTILLSHWSINSGMWSKATEDKGSPSHSSILSPTFIPTLWAGPPGATHNTRAVVGVSVGWPTTRNPNP